MIVSTLLAGRIDTPDIVIEGSRDETWGLGSFARALDMCGPSRRT